MRKNWQTIIMVIMCVMLGICMVQIAELREQLISFEHNTYNRLSYVETNVNRIYSGIDEKLEQQARILADSAWSFGEADTADGTVILKCSIAPKEYQPEQTRAVIFCDDVEYPMTLENGSFVAEIPVSLYQEAKISGVELQDGERIRTEKLDWYVNPRYEYLPVVYAQYSGSSTGTARTGKQAGSQNSAYMKTYSGEIILNIDQKEWTEDHEIKAVTVVECLDDQIVCATEIPKETWKSSGDYHYSWPYEKTITIPFGSTYGVYVDVVDANGLRHRAWIDKERIDVDGNPVKDQYEYWHGAEGSIHEMDGTLVYAPDAEWYRYRALSGQIPLLNQ